ncbi:MAG: DUF5659 domain-containing protein [Candidatus Margulisbacteria bacterium]|nr:DUF5659 domain-containing protein [Candidatus Margulisiibacteriota bacterium]
MKQSLQDKDHFKTSDISLCSALCCYGYRIEAINRDNPSKAIFCIKKDDRLDGLIKLYFAHRTKVDPISFFNYLKEIKTQIYNI